MRVTEIEERRALIPTTQVTSKLTNPSCTFERAFEAINGEGSTMLISCLHEAHELGADSKYLYKLADAVSNFWDVPFNQERLESTIYTFIETLAIKD